MSVNFVVLLNHQYPQLEVLNDLRVLRVLRALQLLERNEHMRRIVESLLAAMPKVGEVFGVLLFFLGLFSILGVQLFMGRLGECSDLTITTREACDSSPEHVWHVHKAIGSFDSFGQGMLLLYVMATGDKWNDVMFRLMDAVGPGVAPERNDFSPAGLFAVAWMFFGSFLGMNLVVGVIVDEFNRVRALTDTVAYLTPEQQTWVNAMRAAKELRSDRPPDPPSNALRLGAYRLVQSRASDVVASALILSGVGLMACYYYGIEHDERRYALYTGGLEFVTYAYYAETALRVAAYGGAYFSDSWRRFDFALVVMTLLGAFAAASGLQSSFSPIVLRVVMLLRVLRIMRFVKAARELTSLLFTLVLSLPALLNIMAILVLIIYVWAVLGMDLFSFVARQENLHAHRNFETFTGAMLVMFECLTNDGWSSFMADAMVSEAAGGACSEADGTCGTPLAALFFVSFQVLGSYVYLNVVVAMMLEHFLNLSGGAGQVPGLVTPEDVDHFHRVWESFDRLHLWNLPSEQLPRLLLKLPIPLGMRSFGTERQAVAACAKLKWLQDGQVSYDEVLDVLITENFETQNIDVDKLRASIKDYGPARDLLDEGGVITAAESRSWDKVRGVMASRRELREKGVMMMPLRQLFALESISENAVFNDFRNRLEKRRSSREPVAGDKESEMEMAPPVPEYSKPKQPTAKTTTQRSAMASVSTPTRRGRRASFEEKSELSHKGLPLSVPLPPPLPPSSDSEHHGESASLLDPATPRSDHVRIIDTPPSEGVSPGRQLGTPTPPQLQNGRESVANGGASARASAPNGRTWPNPPAGASPSSRLRTSRGGGKLSSIQVETVPPSSPPLSRLETWGRDVEARRGTSPSASPSVLRRGGGATTPVSPSSRSRSGGATSPLVSPSSRSRVGGASSPPSYRSPSRSRGGGGSPPSSPTSRSRAGGATSPLNLTYSSLMVVRAEERAKRASPTASHVAASLEDDDTTYIDKDDAPRRPAARTCTPVHSEDVISVASRLKYVRKQPTSYYYEPAHGGGGHRSNGGGGMMNGDIWLTPAHELSPGRAPHSSTRCHEGSPRSGAKRRQQPREQQVNDFSAPPRSPLSPNTTRLSTMLSLPAVAGPVSEEAALLGAATTEIGAAAAALGEGDGAADAHEAQALLEHLRQIRHRADEICVLLEDRAVSPSA